MAASFWRREGGGDAGLGQRATWRAGGFTAAYSPGVPSTDAGEYAIPLGEASH